MKIKNWPCWGAGVWEHRGSVWVWWRSCALLRCGWAEESCRPAPCLWKAHKKYVNRRRTREKLRLFTIQVCCFLAKQQLRRVGRRRKVLQRERDRHFRYLQSKLFLPCAIGHWYNIAPSLGAHYLAGAANNERVYLHDKRRAGGQIGSSCAQKRSCLLP